MSAERVAIVRRIYEAVDAGDKAAIFELYDPEIELDFSLSPFREVLDQSLYRGFDEMRHFVNERDQVMQGPGDRCEDLIDAGDHVISVVRSIGRGRFSGVEVDRVHYGVWAFRGEKVIRVAWYGSKEEALEAAA